MLQAGQTAEQLSCKDGGMRFLLTVICPPMRFTHPISKIVYISHVGSGLRHGMGDRSYSRGSRDRALVPPWPCLNKFCIGCSVF